jgi:hypothetical protein
MRKNRAGYTGRRLSLASSCLILALLGWLLVGACDQIPPPVTSPTPANPASSADQMAIPVLAANSPPPILSPSPTNRTDLKGAASEVGLNLYLNVQDQKQTAQTLEWLADLKAGWVRLPLYWNEVEPVKGQRQWDKIDQEVTTLNQAGIRVMLNVAHTPPWAAITPERPGYPRDLADFGDFMRAAALRYKGQVAAYEIWNEPNYEPEAGKPITAGAYVELLKAGYQAVKESDPKALVVTGGLTPTGVNNPSLAIDDVLFLSQFYAYKGGEAKKYYDILGAHTGSSQNPPDTLWPALPGPGPGWRDHPSFYFRRIEQLRQVMVDNGEANKMIWLTEFGWASSPDPAPNYGYAAQVSEAQQAQYIGQALLKGWIEYNWLERMFIFQLNMALPQFTPDPGDERIAWGLIRRDGTKRPSFLAVQDFIREHS